MATQVQLYVSVGYPFSYNNRLMPKSAIWPRSAFIEDEPYRLMDLPACKPQGPRESTCRPGLLLRPARAGHDSPGRVGLVSVIIPAYNEAATVERTISSVRNQTHSDLEMQVVDDGSRPRGCRIRRGSPFA